MKFQILILSLALIISIQTNSTAEQPQFTVYLIGDVGDPYNGATVDTADANYLALRSLKHHLAAEGNLMNSAVIFLGDNIYPAGLPIISTVPKDQYRDARQRIDAQLEALSGYSGQLYFVPGNHDWSAHKADGWEVVKNQETYVEAWADSALTQLSNTASVFVPNDGCPGPKEIMLDSSLILLVLDTQWWLHSHARPLPEYENTCDVCEEDEVIAKLDSLIKRHQNSQILIVAHHPIYSNGPHGGYYPLKTHIFPLSDLGKLGYLLPLPIIGSLYPLNRHRLTQQDIKSSRYAAMITRFLDVMENHDRLVYAAGHEHSLQYFRKGSASHRIHQIVSGSGCKTSPVKDDDAELSISERGFLQLNYYRDGNVELTVHPVQLQTGVPITIY